MMLGVVCFTSIVVAAVVLSALTTEPKDPSKVSLVKGADEWSSMSGGFQVGKAYDVVMNSYYGYQGQTANVAWSLSVETEASGIEADDFTVSLSINGGEAVELTKHPTRAGFWYSDTITGAYPEASDSLTVTIVPNAGAADLTDVSFKMTATDST